jgi:hypothetical protein
MQLTTDKLNYYNYIEIYRGKFEIHPQKEILNYIIYFDSMRPEYRISRYELNKFENFNSFVEQMMPYTTYGVKHHGANHIINIKDMFNYGLGLCFIYDNTQVLSKNEIFDYEKHIEKQKKMHEPLKALDGMSMCIHEYSYDNECCNNMDTNTHMIIITNPQHSYLYNNETNNLLEFEYSHMIQHTKYKPFIFSYDEFIKSIDERNIIVKEYDKKTLYSIFFNDNIDEFENTESIEVDGNQLEFMCSSKKYYYHVVARR